MKLKSPGTKCLTADEWMVKPSTKLLVLWKRKILGENVNKLTA